MIATAGQKKKLYAAQPGYGWITYNSGNGEITEIEVYVGRDNVLRRVGNGKPLLPLTMMDEDEGIVEITAPPGKE